MISIKLVRVGDTLVGQTASDRWNLMQMGFHSGYVIPADRNQTGIKRLRRAWGTDFTFSVVRGENSLKMANSAEIAALGPKIALIAA